jgi:lipid-A-disaccharide synthase-like uncharacterized protein
VFDLVGIAGITISVAAYVPQVVHLAREHCSAGVSSRAWAMWLASAVLVGAVAFSRGDPVFILLQVSNLICAGAILILARRYRGMVCESHARLAPARAAAGTIGNLELLRRVSPSAGSSST